MNRARRQAIDLLMTADISEAREQREGSWAQPLSGVGRDRFTPNCEPLGSAAHETATHYSAWHVLCSAT